MTARGLLDRLQAGGSEPPDEVGSIIEHLRVLLNTRKGEAVTVPGFGLVDFTDLVHSFPASINTLQASIRTTILEFEPRLRNVTVRSVPDPDPLVLRFEISAQPVQRNGRPAGTLRFHTQVTPGGQFRVGSDG
ncbi:MAG TPA: type VI secretion system baseplate subunit TssE [Myxococcales bacterium]|nr:type VI secretion system baseplate subunit TssE [Myxococcales bacterium]